MRSRGKILCVSHRGEEFDAPEASAKAFELAMQEQAEIIKLDIQSTLDEVPVLSHDETLKRTMGWDVAVEDVTLAQIREKGPFLPVGGYAGERLLTLEEGLKIVRNAPEFWVDFKDPKRGVFEKVFGAFEEEGIHPEERVMIATAGESALLYGKEKYPRIRRVLHVFSWIEEVSEALQQWDHVPVETFLKLREKYGLHGLNLPGIAFREGWLRKETLFRLREEGFWYSIYFVHTAEEASLYRELSPDAFVSGRIRAVRQFC
ncbi:MAG: hypothetical protein J6S58_00950 [Lentisphaeria bacterium]|nr:hypothetical protein [Lentisphaeria bacterium]